MKKFKRLIIASLLCVTALIGYGNHEAKAEGVNSTIFTLQFPKYGGYATTEDRAKYNTSSVYMLCTDVGGDYYYTGFVTLWNGTDVSGGYRKVFDDGYEYHLSNYAVENYGSGVSVRVRGNSPFTLVYYNAEGWWSPDSTVY